VKDNPIVSPPIVLFKRQADLMTILIETELFFNHKTRFTYDNESNVNDICLLASTYASALQGRREYMEDTHLIINSLSETFNISMKNETIEFEKKKKKTRTRAKRSTTTGFQGSRIQVKRSSIVDSDNRSLIRDSGSYHTISTTVEIPKWSTMVESKQIAVYAVFDGHGGDRASKFCKKNLMNSIFSQTKFIEKADWENALKKGLKHLDKEFLDKYQDSDDGTTAIVVLQVNNKLYIGNLGDSRAILCRGKEVIPLSSDHKPDREDEYERIQNLGGDVINNHATGYIPRVNGILAVSRAIGDKSLKYPIPYVIANAEMKVITLGPEDLFIVLASDGLWDIFTNEEVNDFVFKRYYKNRSTAAEDLAEKAKKYGSVDNITVMIVWFEWVQP
jgi:serine/threonine protein phosphatase PrpC